MQLNIPSSPDLGKRPKKEMLSISYETDPVLHRKRPVVKINNSSLDLIQTCKRKAYYALKKEITSSEENSATLFGSAIHKGLETWYSASREARRSRPGDCDGSHAAPDSEVACARCDALQAFDRVATSLNSLDLGDKRHPYNGHRILKAYFDKYQDDPFEILRDSAGAAYVERRFEFTLIDKPDLRVIFFGTIDAILRNVETNATLVCDHKTTSSLGSEFFNRIKPNHQYTGYLLGARRVFGIDTDLFLVNGLQVAKTKADLARQVTQRTEEDFAELSDAVESVVRDYLRSDESGIWPQNAPNPCSMYGGCQFRTLCEAPAILRSQIEQNMFRNQNA